MIPVVISGGSGTRLWPVSRSQFPKQFCELFEEPLQSMTLQRCRKVGSPWILTGAALKTLTEININNCAIVEKRTENLYGLIKKHCSFKKPESE